MFSAPSVSPEERARRVQVILFDVDGVLTDGKLIVQPNPDGSATEVKAFSAHDGLGISLARLGGLRVGVVTKRQSAAVAVRSRDLKLEFVYQGQSHKAKAIHEIVDRAKIDYNQLCYVGDDIVDLPAMALAGLAIATANARPQVKQAAHWITPNSGGYGAGRDAIDFILEAQGSLERVIKQYLDATNQEAAAADVGQGGM